LAANFLGQPVICCGIFGAKEGPAIPRCVPRSPVLSAKCIPQTGSRTNFGKPHNAAINRCACRVAAHRPCCHDSSSGKRSTKRSDPKKKTVRGEQLKNHRIYTRRPRHWQQLGFRSVRPSVCRPFRGESNEKACGFKTCVARRAGELLDSKAEIRVSYVDSVCYRQYAARGQQSYLVTESVNSMYGMRTSRHYEGAIRPDANSTRIAIPGVQQPAQSR